MPKVSIVLVLCSILMSNSSLGSNIEEQKHRIKNSIMLTILGKNVSQFLSIGIATGHQDALRANRNKTEITFEDKASIIFDIFQALSKSNSNASTLEKSDHAAFEKVTDFAGLNNRDNLVKYLAKSKKYRHSTRIY